MDKVCTDCGVSLLGLLELEHAQSLCGRLGGRIERLERSNKLLKARVRRYEKVDHWRAEARAAGVVY